jgi:chaperonin GroEL (HSP60 family)
MIDIPSTLKHYTDLEQEKLSTLESAIDSCNQTLKALQARAQEVRDRMEILNEIRLTLELRNNQPGSKAS